MKTTRELETEAGLASVQPMTPDEKSRLGDIAQQIRTFGEQMDRFAGKLDKGAVIPYTRLSAWAEFAIFVADWIQLDERDPTLQVIARTGPKLTDLLLPHIKSYVIQAEAIATVQQEQFARFMREKEGANGNTGSK